MSEELEQHITYLINNPDKTLGSVYHDAGKCWTLIDRLLERVRRFEAELAAAKEREREVARSWYYNGLNDINDQVGFEAIWKMYHKDLLLAPRTREKQKDKGE